MLDVTKSTSVTAPARPTETGNRANNAPRSDGQDSPVDGMNVPQASVRTEPIELPELERLAESISRFVKSMNRDLTFSVHEASGHTVVTVLDGETKEVIRQIPSEEFLRMSEAVASGRSVLIDTEA